ncbi:MAG TPA: response regulator transcription factor [Burkholderiales bacterium]|nr:response regulator transcription factor [Burkholderiales bacterium]
MSPTEHPPLVYVVDDDDALRDSLSWLLESAGYRAVTYPTAERFLEEYEPGSAVCLVLDVRLPAMSGLDLQQELNRRGESLPIIFISGHGGVPLAVEAMKSGACHFLEKPFQDAQLLSLIERAMARDGSPDATTQKPEQ